LQTTANFVYPVAARRIVIMLLLSEYLNSSHYNNVLATVISLPLPSAQHQ